MPPPNKFSEDQLCSIGFKKGTDGVWRKEGSAPPNPPSGADPEQPKDKPKRRKRTPSKTAPVRRLVAIVTVRTVRPRDYDALLFGTSVGRQGDLYSFWHSSGRSDPGLNIALYTNIDTDAILDDLRQAISPEERDELYVEFVEIIEDETPAVFLFSPDFTYITDSSIQNNNLGILNNASDRFVS